MGQTVSRSNCEACGSNNNLCEFIGDDGNTYLQCKTPGCTMNNASIENRSYRGISQRTLNKYGISFTEIKGKEVHTYLYNNFDGTSDIKYRYFPKDFKWEKGKSKTTNMYLLSECNETNKPLIITEGELDALSFRELDYQACSLTSGASAVEKELTQDIAYINEFDDIILAFDNDDPGKKATELALNILKHKHVSVLNFGEYKDANEVLQSNPNQLKLLTNSLTFKEFPGLIAGKDLNWDELWANPPEGIDLPWPILNKNLRGLNWNNLYLFFGGSSIGKSSVLRELVYSLRTKNNNLKIANIFLEENQEVNPLTYLALDQNIPIGDLLVNKSLIPVEKRLELQNKLLNTENLMFITQDYKRDSETLLQTIEYLSKYKGFQVFVLDHISYIIGRSKTTKDGERRDIDELLYSLQELVKKYPIIILAACHLNDPSSAPSWDEGRIPGLYNGRGSRVLAQVPDAIIGISRNMTDDFTKDTLILHNLKNRWFGQIGEADHLIYIDKTGRLVLK